MASKKEDECKVIPFKDGSKNYWCQMKHFAILDSKLICAAGGIPTEECWNKIKEYLDSKSIKYEK